VTDGALLRMAVYFTVESRRSVSDALQRAAEIAGPPGPEDRAFLVNGWPAVEATRLMGLPRVAQEKAQEKAGQEPEVAKFERTITAIAAGARTGHHRAAPLTIAPTSGCATRAARS